MISWVSILSAENAWLALGLSAQLLFSARFLVQWLASERRGRSFVPPAFWYLSLGGASVLLLYAVHVRDPVFIIGQSTGFFVYARNLVLIKRTVARAGLAQE
ncbi:MAG: lipid-A-disaccharide synthase N-terminal domain-containing protein [Gemmatimonadota bacterium]